MYADMQSDTKENKEYAYPGQKHVLIEQGKMHTKMWLVVWLDESIRVY